MRSLIKEQAFLAGGGTLDELFQNAPSLEDWLVSGPMMMALEADAERLTELLADIAHYESVTEREITTEAAMTREEFTMLQQIGNCDDRDHAMVLWEAYRAVFKSKKVEVVEVSVGQRFGKRGYSTRSKDAEIWEVFKKLGRGGVLVMPHHILQEITVSPSTISRASARFVKAGRLVNHGPHKGYALTGKDVVAA